MSTSSTGPSSKSHAPSSAAASQPYVLSSEKFPASLHPSNPEMAPGILAQRAIPTSCPAGLAKTRSSSQQQVLSRNYRTLLGSRAPLGERLVHRVRFGEMRP